ncbi:MAG: cytochrome P450 [Acidimicrobiales bacterium]|jgi:cytochrome P450|nr:cytochrome P450 [Acidimicrobiales bacterium]
MTTSADLAAIDLYDHRQYAQGVPYEKFDILRREDPVHWHPLPDGDGAWYLLAHRDVMAASKDHRTFSAALGGIVLEKQTEEQLAIGRTQLLSMDPPEHKELRNLVFTAFKPSVVDAMEPWLRDRSAWIFDRALEMGTCDFVQQIAGELPMQLINQMMGIPDEDRTRLADWADRVIAGGGGRDRSADDDPGKELAAYGYRLATERMGKGGTDLITLLTEGTYQGKPLDAQGFAGLFIQIAVAGNETTKSMLSGMAVTFARNPGLYQELASLDRLPATAIEEMLRWTTPVHYFRRTATCDTEFGGKRIAEGDRVVLHYTAADFDDTVFADPMTFDPYRDPNPQLSFGWGEHFCLGARLARMEARTFWEACFQRFSAIELVEEPERLPSNLTNTYTRAMVRMVPR